MKFLNIGILLFLALPVVAQRHCASGLTGKHSPYQAGGKAFEEAMRSMAKADEKSVQADGDSIYYIPVVVHVLHTGEPEGTGKNLSLARIQSQIDILNQDYGRQAGSPGFNTHPAGADTRIRFCLATQDPNGNSSNGIVRVNTGVDAFDLFTQNAQLKGYSLWNPEKYLNIWTCKLLNSYIGYAQYPMISPLWADSLPMVPNPEDVQPDGVVIEYRVFGNVPAGESGPYTAYNQGRTASHEIGHYLGLLHIWGDGTSCADNKTDYCSDTPPQATYTSGCPSVAPVSCTSGTPAMMENYLDYTNDACMNIFTQEQKKRMRMVLRNCIRRKTVKSTNSACGISSVDPTERSPVKPGISLKVGREESWVEVSPLNMEIREIRMFDVCGRTISRQQPSVNYAAYPSRMSTAGLAPGAYFLQVSDGEGIRRMASFRIF